MTSPTIAFRIGISDLAATRLLSGTSAGRRMLAALIASLPDTVPVGPLALDFEGVEHASASFLRESVIAFHEYVRGYLPESFPILLNTSADVEEEIGIVLGARNRAMLSVRTVQGQYSARIIGRLEPALEATLEMLRTRPASAAELAAEGQEVSRTGWTNRLSALLQLGLIAPDEESKNRRYRFVLGLQTGA